MDRRQTKILGTTSPGQVPGYSPPWCKRKLFDQLREALRSRHYSRRTEQAYCHWVKRVICFHNIRHPAEMAEPEVNVFLTPFIVMSPKPRFGAGW